MNYLAIDYLERSACRYADKTAVADIHGRITYEELNTRAGEIATELLEAGCRHESVAVYAVKSVETTCALWGIARAGCYYTFLDLGQPDSRLRKIAEKLGTRYILTDSEHREEAERLFPDRQVMDIALMRREPDEEKLRRVRQEMCCQDPLYVNFTSGTTGEPKGVMVGHLSVVDFIDVFVETFSITDRDVIGNQAPYDFDVSVKDIYSCAAVGATLVIIPREYFTKPKDIMDYLCREKVTTIIWAVSAMCFLSTMKAFYYKVPETIRKIMFSGEVMPVRHLAIWRQFLPDAAYVNLYGPTEITCNCTYYVLDAADDYADGIPIGKPFRNEKVYLVSGEDKLIQGPGEQGEICVAGITLALGYYGDEAETARRFVRNPFNSLYEEKMYRTGDLARYDENGDLRYIGRSDAQVKYLGHRIELSEIEFYANRAEGVERACCVFMEERQRLVLFYAGESGGEQIRHFMEKSLPPHMIPGQYIRVEQIPLTKNGKMDRRKIAAQYADTEGRKV